jgi:hypothetical protein
MLPTRAVLMFVNDQPRIACPNDIADMARTEELRRGFPRGEVVCTRVLKLKDGGVAFGTFWKETHELHRPAVYGRKPVGLRRHTQPVQPAAQRHDSRVCMCQDQDRLQLGMTR